MRVLLDVDGVLNCGWTDTPPDCWSDWEETRAMGFPVRFSREVVRRLAKLGGIDGVDVLWLTTWEELADRHLADPMGLPTWPVAAPRHTTNEYKNDTWWKLQIVRRLWKADRIPFVWLDDDLAYDDEAQVWLETALRPEDALAVAPGPDIGLSPDELEAVESFVYRRVGAT